MNTDFGKIRPVLDQHYLGICRKLANQPNIEELRPHNELQRRVGLKLLTVQLAQLAYDSIPHKLQHMMNSSSSRSESQEFMERKFEEITISEIQSSDLSSHSKKSSYSAHNVSKMDLNDNTGINRLNQQVFTYLQIQCNQIFIEKGKSPWKLYNLTPLMLLPTEDHTEGDTVRLTSSVISSSLTPTSADVARKSSPIKKLAIQDHYDYDHDDDSDERDLDLNCINQKEENQTIHDSKFVMKRKKKKKKSNSKNRNEKKTLPASILMIKQEHEQEEKENEDEDYLDDGEIREEDRITPTLKREDTCNIKNSMKSSNTSIIHVNNENHHKTIMNINHYSIGNEVGIIDTNNRNWKQIGTIQKGSKNSLFSDLIRSQCVSLSINTKNRIIESGKSIMIENDFSSSIPIEGVQNLISSYEDMIEKTKETYEERIQSLYMRLFIAESSHESEKENLLKQIEYYQNNLHLI